MKKVFLEISQNSQENTCARVSFLIKLQANLVAQSALEKFTYSSNSLVSLCEFAHFSHYLKIAPLLASYVIHVY